MLEILFFKLSVSNKSRMSTASSEDLSIGGTHTYDPTGLDNVSNNSSSEEDELVRKWNAYKAKMIFLNAKMDRLQSRIEAIEEKLLTFEFPERRVRGKPEVKGTSDQSSSDIVVIGYCARRN